MVSSPVTATVELTHKAATQVRAMLILWINANAATFPLAQYGSGYSHPPLGETVQGIPFNVSLHRWAVPQASPLSTRFWLNQHYSGGRDDLEPARLIRAQKVCQDKFPKLANWKRSDNARSVLVLEENDFQTNHQLVADTMALAENGRDDRPDEVFLVTTMFEPWSVSCLRRSGKSYYDDGERFHKFAPDTLTRLTKRGR